jgi:hypothetical protein
LATNAFIPDGVELSLKDVSFNVYHQKAMANYLGLLVINKWGHDINSLLIDNVKMNVLKNLLTPDDIGMKLLQP